jgi:hypothetical protein
MGGKVVSGQAVIQQATQAGQSVTTITQSTPKATLSWQSFNVGSGEAVRRPWSSVTDNQAKLSGTGVRLSWAGPHQWSASLSFGRALGKTPSLLSGSSSLHTSAWLELVRKFK